MTKRELIKRLKRRAEITTEQAEIVVNEFLDALSYLIKLEGKLSGINLSHIKNLEDMKKAIKKCFKTFYNKTQNGWLINETMNEAINKIFKIIVYSDLDSFYAKKLGSKGGKKSKRTITSEQQKKMQKAREYKKH
jgi:hypothetical protein